MPQHDLDALKRDFPRSRLLQLAALEGLGRRGNRIQCPACRHEDPRGASTGEPDGIGLWSCQRCGAGGTAIDLVAAARGVPTADAIAVLAEFNGAVPAPPPERKHPPRDGAALYDRLADADSEGLAYLEKRGLALAAERNLLRFNTGGTGDIWLDMRAREGYRVAVPLRNQGGIVKTFQLRCCRTPEDPRKTKLNLPGVPMSGLVFGEPASAKRGRVYLAEGLADTLAIQLAGVVVIGAPGVDQIGRFPILLGDLPGREIVLCPQNDLQHHQSELAFAMLGRHLRDAGARVLRLRTPAPHKDPADWAKAAGLEAFRDLVLAAPDLASQPFEPAPAPPAPLRAVAGGGAEPVAASVPLSVVDVGPEPQGDTANALLFASLHANQLRYCADLGRWLAWDGRRWSADAGNARALHASQQIARALHRLAGQERSESRRREIQRRIVRAESVSGRRAAVDLASVEPSISVRMADLDADPWLLTCDNGTIDLRTGTLRAHDRADLVSRMTAPRHVSDAPAPLFARFLRDTFGEDADMLGFVQRAVGYTLTGSTREQCLFLCHGAGANGKSVFLHILRALLGEFATSTSFETLASSRDPKAAGSPRPDLVALRAARVVTACEPDRRARWNTALVKELTGEDPISARGLHQEQQQFLPHFKLWIACNHRPRVPGDDGAFWRRIRLLPFLNTVPPERQDRDLAARIVADELPGVLAWALAGCLAWQTGGLGLSLAVQAATESYRTESDALGRFLADMCCCGSNYSISKPALWSAWDLWCQSEGEEPGSKRMFLAGVREKGFAESKNNTARIFRGLCLVSDKDNQTAGEQAQFFSDSDDSNGTRDATGQ